MKTSALVCCGLAALLLSACAAHQLRPYQAPTVGPTATLSIEALVGAGMPYTVLAFADAQACNDPQPIASNSGSAATASAPPTGAALTIGAGQLATLAVRMGSAARCEVIVSFVPRAGHSYRLSVDQQQLRCGLGIDDVSGGVRVAEALERRTARFGACIAQPGLEQLLLARAPSTPRGRSLDDFKNLLPGA